MLAEVEGWAAQFERLCQRIGPRFARPEVRRRAAVFLRGLLGDVARKNGWQLAEHASETTPGRDAAAVDHHPLGRRCAPRRRARLHRRAARRP
jgi:hypothetical protein